MPNNENFPLWSKSKSFRNYPWPTIVNFLVAKPSHWIFLNCFKGSVGGRVLYIISFVFFFVTLVAISCLSNRLRGSSVRSNACALIAFTLSASFMLGKTIFCYVYLAARGVDRTKCDNSSPEF